jgi:hypothetical protein
MIQPDTAEAILAGIEESEALWPHNDILYNDHAIDLAVQHALAKPIDGMPSDVAGLLRSGGNRPGVSRRLFLVVFGRAAQTWTDYDLFCAPCDRCLRDVQPEHTLWIPAGRSVVELHVCRRCHDELDADFSGIVWE